MLYARQVSPEYQESPLFFFDEWPEGIILDGNRDYDSHTTPEYDCIINHFDDMASDWENTRFYYTYENGKYIKHKQKPEYTLAEILHEWGFDRPDGKPWTNKQKHEWRLLMEGEKAGDNDEVILAALRLLTGHKWDTTTIRGCCQSDWQDVFYNVDMWSRESLDAFETEYFNTGTEWIIHDEAEDPESPEDISGYFVYCVSWNDEGIRQELAEAGGEKPENVVMYAYDGYHTVPKYKEVI